jgi:biopolymer transport protein ExbD
MDMTPLIDVVFLLLLFFVLSSAFIVQPGIKVDAPRSVYGPGIGANRLIVSVMLDPAAEGGQKPVLFFNDRLMSLREFGEALPRLARGGLNQTAVLKIDQQVPTGVAVEIMNVCMAHNVGVVLATQRP